MYGIYENNAVIAKFTAPLTIKSNQPSFVSDTLSLKRQITKRAAQRWEISTNIEPLSKSAFDLFVNLVTKGLSETVTVLMPQNYSVIDLATYTSGTPACTGSVGASQISITNFIGNIPKGIFIKFANHSKIYLATSTVSATSAGQTYNLNIYPTLQTALSSTSLKYQNDVLMNCLYDTDTVQGMIYSDGILMDMGEIKLVEKL